MNFILYDLIFFALFTLAVVIFLYSRRSNLKREGLLYLYRTKVGIRFIEWTSKKFSSILKPMQYLIVTSGYALMILMIWFLVRFSYFYLTSPFAAQALKVPVLIPLIPYLPRLFNISFLPPFYFTYWIIIIAIIAIPHEFAHGIFARLNKVKVHSTGFGFLGPFLAAFVEPDEKEMAKSSKFAQLSVLASGTFANIIVALLFALLFWVFFAAAFVPAGVNFNSYSTTIINTSEINLDSLSLDSEIIPIKVDNKTYYITLSTLQRSIDSKLEYLFVYEDTPAFRSNLSSPILEIDGKKIISFDGLRESLSSKDPGDKISIKSLEDGEIKEYEIVLDERNGNAFLGIGIIPPQSSGIAGWISSITSKVRDPFVYYESKWGDSGIFIYDLLWWAILVSLSVALVNMIPVGIFDGGRFFYLTIAGLTGSEKIARRAFAFSTWAILFIVALLMIKWFVAVVL